MMSLQRRGKSDAAMALARDIKSRMEAIEDRKRARRSDDDVSFFNCIDRMLADLLRASFLGESPWVYRSTNTNSFSGASVGYKTFMSCLSLMSSCGFIEVWKGGSVKNPFYDPSKGSQAFNPGLASRMKATPSLIRIARRRGLTKSSYYDHYVIDKPKALIRLKASSTWSEGSKSKGGSMSFDACDATRYFEGVVSSINDYLFRQEIEGGVFSGYQMIFNEGDKEGFNWNRGGRLYCLGDDSYQMMKKARRLRMTFNGEPVSEIDVNASWLTVFAGLVSQKLPKGDPYKVKGVDRRIVKAFVTATLGSDAIPARWPRALKASLVEDGVVIGRRQSMGILSEEILKALPLLGLWEETSLRWSDLMFVEAMIMQNAMRKLIDDHDVCCLIVHDSLIVPSSKASLAADVIRSSFEARLGVIPRLSSASSKGRLKAI